MLNETESDYIFLTPANVTYVIVFYTVGSEECFESMRPVRSCSSYCAGRSYHPQQAVTSLLLYSLVLDLLDNKNSF